MNHQEFVARMESSPQVNTISYSGNGVSDLLLNHSAKVEFRPGVTGSLGCGSLIVAREVMEIGDNFTKPFAITVGHYCESAFSRILLGSEHPNDKAVNVSFSQFRNLQQAAENRNVPIGGSFSRGPVTIGHNVVISQNSVILSGITIGNGAVIGAGAVVVKDVPSYAVVAGNPARLIHYRFDEEMRERLDRLRWWDLKQTRLVQLYPLIQQMQENPEIEQQLALKPEDYRTDHNCYWMFKYQAGSQNLTFDFLGAEIKGIFHPLDKLPALLKHYTEQAQQPVGSPFTRRMIFLRFWLLNWRRSQWIVRNSSLVWNPPPELPS